MQAYASRAKDPQPFALTTWSSASLMPTSAALAWNTACDVRLEDAMSAQNPELALLHLIFRASKAEPKLLRTNISIDKIVLLAPEI